MRAVPALAFAFLATPVLAGEPTMHFGGPGMMFGTWDLREFVVASDGSDSFAKGGLPQGLLTLEEADGGKLSGTLEIYDRTVTLAGTVDYAGEGVTVRMNGTVVIEGVTYRETYFGYVLPSWSNADEQLPTFIGTTTRFDPAHPDAMGGTASFVAVHEF
jgi:hypothetical protein